MVQIRKVEGQVKIRSDADKFFDAWARKPYTISKMCPSKVTNMELIEGDWHVAGAKYIWTYAVGNQSASATTLVEKLDEKNRTLYYNIVDGNIMKHDYKSYRDNIQIIPAGDGSIVKWCIEYEKMREDAPEADIYLDFLLDCAKDMDAKLCTA